MAVVIDYCGYSLADVQVFTTLAYPLTLAVIRGQAYSRVCAREISGAGKALLIHFPWAPLGPAARQAYPVRIEQGFSTTNVAKMLDRALASVPSADGINNHQGSALSRDQQMLNKFMGEWRQRQTAMFFLDSSTTRNSRAANTALRHGIPAAHNDLFLDGVQTAEAIEKRFAEAVQLARRQGTAVVIAHAGRPVTRRVLKKLLTKYNSQVDFVLLPEIIAERLKQ